MRTWKVNKSITYEEERRFLFLKSIVIWEATATAEISHDPSYGADADGRRGVPMNTVEDVTFTGITKDGKDIEEKRVPKHVLEAFDSIADDIEWYEVECQSDEDARADEGDRRYHEAVDEGRI